MRTPDLTWSDASEPGGATRGRRRLYAALCVALPLLAVLGVEGMLQMAGWGGQTPILQETVRMPDRVLMTQHPDGTKPYFFANAPNRTGSSVQGHFWSPKPAGTLRVFLLGGSAIQGFPQPRHLRISAFLQAMLSDLWPERTVEVVNLGATAVASFPVSDILEQTLVYRPDLVVIYSGHNELYGAYGSASSKRAGSRPWMQQLYHRGQNLALIQAGRAAVTRSAGDDHRDLMEAMIGTSQVPGTSWRRGAAFRTLKHNLNRMIRSCREASVPVMVCTLPSNERDLAPIGPLDRRKLDPQELQALDHAAANWTHDPDGVISAMRSLVASVPDLAHAHFYLGKALEIDGRPTAAARHFILARDLDPMPWRATSRLQQAIRDVAATERTQLCDVEAFFREHSTGGSIGWALMDDHVHPSLQGQARVAEAIVRSLPGLKGSLQIDPEGLDRLRTWETYARELGDNPYDRYGVHRWALKIFSIPFMAQANPGAKQRFKDLTERFEQGQTPLLRATLQAWRSTPPLCFQVALAMMQQGRHRDALPLLQISRRAVDSFSSGHLACTYYELACIQALRGTLSPEEREQADQAIWRGERMLEAGATNQGARERFMGRLHYLRGEFDQAIPYLTISQARATAQNRVADDQALFDCYRHTGQLDRARTLAARGARLGGPFTPVYQEWLNELGQPEDSNRTR